MGNSNNSRRDFLKKSALTTGLTTSGVIGLSRNSDARQDETTKPPREIWIAGISTDYLHTKTSRLMIDAVTGILQKVAVYKPDVICLPENFSFSRTDEKLSLSEKLEITEFTLKHFAALAKKYNSYMVCPGYTSEGSKAYNSAVILNRSGDKIGVYHKAHITEGEINKGLTPGPLSPPVFQTDFGKIGVQICFDLLWDDTWTALRKKGAEIVFWPAAYAGGNVVNAKAWQHKYVVASSTLKNTSKLCDITGEVITQTGIWEKNFYCAPVNLEKAFLHTYPFYRHFDDIREKYGRKVKITTFHEEEWSIIESLSPEVSVKDILKEFNLKTHEQHTHDAEKAQTKARNI